MTRGETRDQTGAQSGAEPIRDDDLDDLFGGLARFPHLVLAVSGGADSMALLHLVARWARRRGGQTAKVVVATVDHGLRPASAQEAEFVGGVARGLGLPHEALRWEGAKPLSGVQAAARAARYDLLADLALRIAGDETWAMVTAHHLDDQVETFLMRLARGSGLDGLGGMARERRIGPGTGGMLVRPLLEVPKARLIATLEAAGQRWVEDPSNDDAAFERVRVRQAAPALAQLGVSPEMIALSMRRLGRARAAIEVSVDRLAAAAGLDVHRGAYASFAYEVYGRAPEELRARLLARLIGAFGGQGVAPRLAKVEDLGAAIAREPTRGVTLGGAIVVRDEEHVQVFREPGREGLPEIAVTPGTRVVWDRRFLVQVATGAGMPVTVKALGPQAYATLRVELAGAISIPARAAVTLPSFWRGERLVALPCLAPGAAWLAGEKRDGAAMFRAEFLHGGP